MASMKRKAILRWKLRNEVCRGLLDLEAHVNSCADETPCALLSFGGDLDNGIQESYELCEEGNKLWHKFDSKRIRYKKSMEVV